MRDRQLFNQSSSVSNVPFFFGCPQDIFFVFVFQQFDYMCGSGFLWVYPFGICRASWISRIILHLSANMGSFQLLLLQIFCCTILSLLSFWDLMTQMFQLWYHPTGTWSPDNLKTKLFFSSMLRLSNFYWYIFEYTESFLCHLHVAIELIEWVFFLFWLFYFSIEFFFFFF